MAVKIFIKRIIKDGKLNDASKLLIRARYNAMDQNGYISSETLSGCDDPNRVMVVSMWQRLEDWNRWKDNDLRKENEAAFELLLNEPTEYETYEMGLQL